MFRKLGICIGIVLTLLLTATASAQQQEHTAPYWDAWFWNNMTLTGEPVLRESHTQLCCDCGPLLCALDSVHRRGGRHVSLHRDQR
jgi:hypothetical protein